MESKATPRLAGTLCAAGLLAHALLVPVSIAGMQIGLGVAAAGLGAAALSGWRPRRTALDLPLLALVACCVISDALSPFGSPPAAYATLWRSAFGFWVIAQALPLAASPQARARQMLLAAALGLAASALVGIVQYRTGVDVVHLLGLRSGHALVEAPGVPGRYGAMGFFTSRLTFGHNASALIALLLGACASGALRGRERAAALVAAGLSLVAVLLTFDRAAYLGLVAAAAVGVLLLPARDPARTRRRRLSFALGLLLAVGAAASVAGVRARFASAFDVQGNSDRLFLWTRATEIIRDHPLLGIGFGNYPRVCSLYYDRVDPQFAMRTWAHNSELSLLAETGPLGLLAGLWVAGAALVALLRRLREEPHGLALGALGAAVTVAAIAQVHDVLYDTKVMYALWLSLGCALGAPPAAAPAPLSGSGAA